MDNSGCQQTTHDPAGLQYNVLIGPAFFFFFTAAGIPLGILADVYSRRVILGASVFLWSACTACTGVATAYWHVLVLRIGIAVGESTCVPLCTSLIADHFSKTSRGAALGFFTLGVNAGYSLAFTLADTITRTNILNQGWRWAFILVGLPGLLVSVIIGTTLHEPPKVVIKRRLRAKSLNRQSMLTSIKSVLVPFSNPALLTLCTAASIRLTVGILWAYNVQTYFMKSGESAASVAGWLSWIPMVSGSLGTILGGVFSDILAARWSLPGRLWVLLLSQLTTAPFAAVVLYFPTPAAYYALIPVYLLGEMFCSVVTAVLVELVPSDVRTSTVAFFWFVTTNAGGSLQLLMEPLVLGFSAAGFDTVQSFRMGLYVMFSGGYALASLLFAMTLVCVVLRRRAQHRTPGLQNYQKDSTSTLYAHPA